MDAAVLKAAVDQGARVFTLGSDLYAASWFDVGWWCWKLEYSSTEHFVTDERCTCSSFQKQGRCKHHEYLYPRRRNVRRERGER